MKMFRKLRGQGPWLLASAIALGLLLTSIAGAAGGHAIIGGKRNPGTNPSKTLSSETQIIASNGTYGTRQSNKSDSGGGAIYGCRSTPGGSPKGKNPCIRANNLAGGRAFEFATANGPEVGAITSANPKAAPFITNAHGVATGLNADQVDGKSADEIKADTLKDAHADAVTTAQAAVQGAVLFAVVGQDGKLGAHRGATAAAKVDATTGDYTVTFAEDISACAMQATEATVTDAGAVGVQLDDDKKTVHVRTRAGGEPGGTAANAAADRPFHLTVTC
ncbi:MAG TPA: hypothetical protein VFT50_19255 [Baekduia sp.]|nr:hypothetical protein [Baekduia sp.]